MKGRAIAGAAVVLGIALAACGGGGNSASYHLGYTTGQSGAVSNRAQVDTGGPQVTADHWCHSVPSRGGEHQEFVQGCLDGFHHGYP